MAEGLSRQPQILLTEDEKNLGLTLSEQFEQEGFSVSWARSVQESFEKIRTQEFDLAVLDLNLPDGSGFDVAQVLRDAQPGAGVVFLTACGNPEDRIRGLEWGAEDYVVKPFHLKELILRVRKGLRKSLPHVGEMHSVQIGKAKIHFEKFEAVVQDRTVSLTNKEVALLKLLTERRGRVVSRDDILDRVWSEEEFPTPRTVDNFVMRLRRLVETESTESNDSGNQIIRTIRGVGYQLI
jgi:two-component system, OmpR family, alkaline phosphatase synthesis response regulator PhoP